MKFDKSNQPETETRRSFLEQAKHWNLNEWQRNIEELGNEFALDLVPIASNHYDPNQWQAKLHILINCISEASVLESIGKQLSLEQLHEILFMYSSKPNDIAHVKISAIFLGVSNTLFYGLVVRMSPEQLRALQQSAAAGSIQHHLSELSLLLEQHFNELCNKIETQEAALLHVNFRQLDADQIDEATREIEALSRTAHEILHVCNRALAIGWNTQCADLIQRLSHTKELCHRCLLVSIGSPGSEESGATGLWRALIEKTLEQ